MLIAGPTASGKSAAALILASSGRRSVVNADSMQVYDVLRILTARPGDDELSRAPHLLYGHVSPATAYSVGAWLDDVQALHEAKAFRAAPPIFVGGTGLYFRALTQGLAALPTIPAETRERWRARMAEEGPTALHRMLAARDPLGAVQLSPGDSQRIVRALEVLEATGRPLREWQAGPGTPLVDMQSARCFVLEPDRRTLHERIDARFDAMMDHGARDEALAVDAMALDASLPATKAIGLRELLAAERGELDRPEAVLRAKAATRQYAKRQSTWFRHQFGPEWTRVPDLKELLRLIL